MSTPPLSELSFDTDELPGFDPFTPHIRVLSLGGIHVHEGGWTAGELLQKIRLIAPHETIAVADEGGLGQIFVQLNALRITWLSSLMGIVDSKVAVVLLDARLGHDWIDRSLQRVSEELTLWRQAHLRVNHQASLSLWIWVELPPELAHNDPLHIRVDQALEQLKRIARTQQAHILEVDQGSALYDQDEARSFWCKLTHHLTELAEIQTMWSTQRTYIDSFAPLNSGHYYQGGGRLSSSVERPQHRVKLSRNLWVSQTPVTRVFWSTVMGVYRLTQEGEELSEHLPISNISWFDALRFCNRLSELEGLECSYEIEDHPLPKVTWKCDATGYRLLTESEWEYACRGGVASSPTAPTHHLPPAWTANRAQLSTHPVAELLPNGWGLYDCLGNVAEWCQDTYIANAYQRRASQHLSVDPCEYDVTAGERVIRGGAFDTEPYLATPSRRDSCPPQRAWSSIGLRVARPR